MKKVWLVSLLCGLFLPFAARGHQTEAELWPIVERCLPEPSTAPVDWSFEGDILMDGWAGIHAVNAELDTPYIVHWGTGLLSPDGEWILNWEYDYDLEQNDRGFPMAFYNYDYHDVEVIHINSGERLTFPWWATLSISAGPYPYPGAGPLWLDNERFVTFYGWGGIAHQVGDLKTGEITDWDGISLHDYETSISPDGTRIISYSSLFDRTESIQITDTIVGTDYDLRRALWSPDSSRFADFLSNENDNTRFLSIFDRNGNLIAQPMQQVDRYFVLEAWSSDADQLALTILRQPDPEDITIRQYTPYIVDVHAQVVYDLCIEDARGWAWSPDGSSFATILGDGQQPVVIVDIEQWKSYIVAYHAGRVLRWRSVSG